MVAPAPTHDWKALQLLQEGALALARVEEVGFRVDEDYVKRAIEDTKQDQIDRGKALQETKIGRIWKERFGSKFNLDSNTQLGTILFDVLDYKCPTLTESGRYGTDEETLTLIDDPFIESWIRRKKANTAISKLKEVLRETVNGVCRPNYNLNTVDTYRSSSDDPNFQNFPNRIEWMRELVRRAIHARPGRRLVDKDYKGVEVTGAYCYHKDPAMRTYLLDKTKDMHRDSAMDIYCLGDADAKWFKSGAGKAVRHAAKNKFVFPQFYGSWYIDCAAALWNMMETSKLKAPDGRPLREWLASQGIQELGSQTHDSPDPTPGSFGEHIQTLERKFWKKRFPVYAQWKLDWYEKYLERGWFRMKTGFVCQGLMRRNEVINYPVQGASFHCLLWSLIQIVKELEQRQMRTRIVGQIHDSILADVPDDELEEYDELADDIMTRRIRDHWDWIIIPLETETDITPIGGSWVDKKEGWKVGDPRP